MTKRRLTACLVGMAALAPAAPARAGFFPSQTVDGPSPDVVALGGVSLARNGTGAVSWLRRDAGEVHVYVAALNGGSPVNPTRVDIGQSGDSSDARVASAGSFRTLVVWVNGGKLYGALRPNRASGYGPPVLIYADPGGVPVSAPSLDMTTFGTGYVSFNVGGDVRAARLSVPTSEWTVQPQPLDIDPLDVAGPSSLAGSADGTAIVVWPETGADGVSHVYERRIRHDGSLSAAPREASVRSLSGRPGGSADNPSVDIEDDSSYAFVTFRQDFVDNGAVVSRSIARRLVASKFEPAKTTDRLRFPATDGAARSVVATEGRGRAFDVTAMRSGRVLGQRIDRREPLGARWFRPISAGSGAPPAAPPLTATIAEHFTGVAAWQGSSGGVPAIQARVWDGRRFRDAVQLSDSQFGPAAGALGLDSASDQQNDSVVGFVQGLPGALRVAVSAYQPTVRRATVTSGGTYWSRQRQPVIRWKRARHKPTLWRPIRYRVEVDGAAIGTTTKTSMRPPRPLPDGAHAVRVVAINRGGLGVPSLDGSVRVDTTDPAADVRRSGGDWLVSASDGPPMKGSGIARLRVDFTSGSVSIPVPRIGIVVDARIRHGGRPVRLVVVDKAGNKAVVPAAAG